MVHVSINFSNEDSINYYSEYTSKEEIERLIEWLKNKEPIFEMNEGNGRSRIIYKEQIRDALIQR